MTWEYRVLDDAGTLAIYGVYYHLDGTVKAHSLEPAVPTGRDLQDLEEELERYSNALKKPILQYEG